MSKDKDDGQKIVTLREGSVKKGGVNTKPTTPPPPPPKGQGAKPSVEKK